jgi:hypothetical protein
VSAQIALRSGLRDLVGPAVRQADFKGSGSTWQRSNSAGDWAVVNVQSSPFSTAAELYCVINLSIVPAPWLDWEGTWLGSLPKNVRESLGLYRDRLHPAGSPPGRDVWWTVHDRDDAPEAAHDMVAQLEARGLPLLLKLLNREDLLAAIRARDLGHLRGPNLEVFFKCAEAVLIADYGPTPELTGLLDYVTACCTPAQRRYAEKFADWARTRAASAQAQDRR